jgi:hypothetical protein
MTRTITNKLAATVLEIIDLGGLFPTPTLKGLIGLDIRVERGALSPGKRVRLSGPASQAEVEIVGVEMLSNPQDPNVVRILCARPKMLTIPAGKTEGWNIAED